MVEYKVSALHSALKCATVVTVGILLCGGVAPTTEATEDSEGGVSVDKLDLYPSVFATDDDWFNCIASTLHRLEVASNKVREQVTAAEKARAMEKRLNTLRNMTGKLYKSLLDKEGPEGQKRLLALIDQIQTIQKRDRQDMEPVLDGITIETIHDAMHEGERNELLDDFSEAVAGDTEKL